MHGTPWEIHRDALAEYLRAQRKYQKLSLRELGALTHLSNAYISQLERGLHDPSLRVLRALAEALNVSVASMLAQAGLYADDDEARIGDEATEAAILADSRLSEDKKEALLAVYRSYVNGL
jgi:transcriptional regulator with XRE-family HTH domain